VLGSTRTVRTSIGWTAWSDAEFITRLTERVVEEHFGIAVELVLVVEGLGEIRRVIEVIQ